MDVIARLEALMKERGWTRYRLTMEADLPHTTIANIFSRGSVPSIPTIEHICKALGISLSEFFMEEHADCFVLSAEQKQLLSHWNSLNSKQQQIVMDLMKHMNDSEASPSEL